MILLAVAVAVDASDIVGEDFCHKECSHNEEDESKVRAVRLAVDLLSKVNIAGSVNGRRTGVW